MLARTCNRKPCDLAQFETTLRMALPAARISCRACHVRCRHDVEPEERFKLNRNKYHAVVAARKRSDPFRTPCCDLSRKWLHRVVDRGAIPDSPFGRSSLILCASSAAPTRSEPSPQCNRSQYLLDAGVTVARRTNLRPKRSPRMPNTIP